MPVNSVWNGIGESLAPTMVNRSAGMPEKSQPIALSERNTTNSAIESTPIPE